MEALKKRRRVIKLNLTRLKESMESLVSTYPILTIEKLGKLEALMYDYRTHKLKFEDTTDEILTLINEDDPEYDTKTRAFLDDTKTISDVSSTFEGKIKTFHRKLSTEESRKSLIPPPELNQSFRSSNQPKLEKIQIPSFNGEILNFYSFKGLFENLVHNNTDLSNVQKLYYLKQALTGKACEMIRDFELNETSYAEAWSYILSRFDNKRSLLRALFRKFRGIEAVKCPSKIRSLMDQIDIIIHRLKAAGEKIDDTFSRYITYHVSSCLDPETARDWENSITTSNTYPKYEELRKFLQIRSFSVEERQFEKPTEKCKPTSTKPTAERKTLIAGTDKIKCIVCSNSHYLNQCNQFISKNINDRFEIVKKGKLCLKCFNPFHFVSNCKRNNCFKCNGNHHVMLHHDNYSKPSITISSGSSNQATNSNSNQPKSTPSTAATATLMSNRNNKQKVVILPTAVVQVIVNFKRIYSRVLLDAASEITLVSKSFVNRSGVRTTPSTEKTSLYGVTDGMTVLDRSAQLVIKSRFSSYQLAVEAEVINKLPYKVCKNVSKIIENNRNLKFAECELPYNEIDIILGAEYYEFVMEEQCYFIEGISLRNTKFGYVVSGSTKTAYCAVKNYCGLTRSDIDSQLQKFWEIEETSENHNSHNSEILTEFKFIEEHFEKTYSQDLNGRFIVSLPTKPSIQTLHGSYHKALQLLLRSERTASTEIRNAYLDFMSEYENLGHMRKLTDNEVNSVLYYIPHHIVRKLNSTTTKYRVVFNASAKDKSGTSLNDHLMIGPSLQPELFDIIVGFRCHRIAFCADIEKMYRQILINPNDRKYQCILWRSKPDEQISVYELNTVTYGTSSASYLATKCIQVVSNKLEKSNRNAANVIRNNCYMDDLMTGSPCIETAIELQNCIHSTLLDAGFPLRKYQSNSLEFLQSIDKSLIETTNTRNLGIESFVNVLGLIWYTNSDTFRVTIPATVLPNIITKRILLSDISRIFDVLGMLSPVTIRAKIMLQALWREEIKWDDHVSDELATKFIEYRNELVNLQNYAIPRCYFSSLDIKCQQLVGFCDASLKAYCGVIYLRTEYLSGEISVTFVCAKARVAPLKSLTIPRLELQSALLLSKLINRVSLNVNIEKINVIVFSDSTIVLNWMKHPIIQLKQFVANRIKKINELVNVNSWNYVQTNCNPADLATRGLTVTNFLNNPLWLNGPEWLKTNINEITNVNVRTIDNLPELRNIRSYTLLTNCDISILTRFSTYNKLINVIAYIFRFVRNSTNIILQYSSKVLTTNERANALNVIIRISQQTYFSVDLTRLNNGKTAKKGSNLISLDPFLDNNNILRVKGRLQNSNLSYDKRHPIILSVKCNIVRLLIKHVHEKFFHCAKDVIYTYIQNSYWIVGGLNSAIKGVIRNCVFCTRLRAVTGSQLMGQLPAARVNISRPFTHVGVDFTGHFTVKCLGHRNIKHNKAYAAFFVCFCTRAVHIELVSDLTAEMFLKALRRFVARRGLPNCIYSDNGKTFVGANNILFNERSKLLKWASNQNIKWQFITPRAPHQGGLWESAVKSGKSLILKATKNEVFTLEDLTTIFCQVESILNSRPLCYQRSNDKEFEVITPGHFLVQDHLLAIPIDQNDAQLSLPNRLKATRSVLNSFWKQWSKTYLNCLQRRNKWAVREENMKIDDIVVMKEDNIPVMQWLIGRIVEVYPDSEGFVRNLKVKTAHGEYNRSISKIVKLFGSESTLSAGELC